MTQIMTKTTEGQFIFLGTGGSMGVPVVGCPCAVCHSSSRHNTRLRPSALIKIGGKQILVDSGPDFRYQALKFGIREVDGVILTHAHHDHTAGVDELRIFTLRSGQPLPCLMSEETFNELKTRFYYIFDPRYTQDGVKLTTDLAIQPLTEESGTVSFKGLGIRYMSYHQGGMRVNGLRFGDLAYVTDIKDYSPEIFDSLKGLKTLIISALRFTPSHLHFTVDEAVDFAIKVGAENTWLTHIAHELDHERTNAYLPESIRLSYDGLELKFNAEFECDD
jgi:phosphoribosyl 1,2-cyclic phosphate phosphodiesterase